MRALRNIRFLSAALLCVAMTGTAGFHYIEHWSWFDGFYMVLTTLTTIGYQEVHPLSQAGDTSTLSSSSPASAGVS